MERLGAEFRALPRGMQPRRVRVTMPARTSNGDSSTLCRPLYKAAKPSVDASQGPSSRPYDRLSHAFVGTCGGLAALSRRP